MLINNIEICISNNYIFYNARMNIVMLSRAVMRKYECWDIENLMLSIGNMVAKDLFISYARFGCDTKSAINGQSGYYAFYLLFYLLNYFQISCKAKQYSKKKLFDQYFHIDVCYILNLKF